MAEVSDERARPGVLDLYRAALGDTRARLTSIRRERVAVAVELFLIVSYVVIRSTDAGRPWLIGWTVMLALVSILAPASGLTAFVAVVPFSEWFLIDRDTGVKILIPPMLGLGLLLRLAIARTGFHMGLASGLTIGVLIGTGLGVLQAALRFGMDFGFRALVYWMGGLGGGLIVMLVARHAGRSQNLRPVIAATTSIAIAALASLVDFMDSDVVRSGALGWLMRPTLELTRLTGIIPAPNAVAAFFMAGAAVMVAVLLFGRHPGVVRGRFLLLAPIAWSAVAIWFTYSRTGILGFFLLAVLYAMWWRRRVGLTILALGLALAIVAVPVYLQYRAGTIGAGAISASGGFLTLSDVERLGAWGATWRLWLDSPVIGAGTLAFKQLHAVYGSLNITAPHNELLRLMAEDGVIVATAFVALCTVVGLRLWRARDVLALASLGALVSLLAGASYNNPFGYVQVVVPVFAIVGCGLARPYPQGSAAPVE